MSPHLRGSTARRLIQLKMRKSFVSLVSKSSNHLLCRKKSLPFRRSQSLTYGKYFWWDEEVTNSSSRGCQRQWRGRVSSGRPVRIAATRSPSPQGTRGRHWYLPRHVLSCCRVAASHLEWSSNKSLIEL